MKIPVTNNTDMPIYVGTSMVPAGETRHFDEEDVPHHLRPAPAVEEEPAPPASAMEELISSSVKDIAEVIPGLTLADLELLGEMEQAGQARKTLLAAIATEILARQAGIHLTQVLDGTLDDIVAALPALSIEDLAKANDMEQVGQAREAVMNAIAAEQLKRAG